MAMGQKTQALRDLLLAGRLYNRAKGQVIQTTESEKTFNLIKSGYIKRYLISNSGTLGVQTIYGPSDFFSITQVYKVLFKKDPNEGPEIYYYEAMANTEIYSIDILTLVEAAKQNQVLYRDFLLVAGNRLSSTLHGLENLTMRTAYKRVAHQLLYFARRFGEKKLGGQKIALPLTHQDIADVLSLTRETVSMSMVQLREKKLIVTNRYITIPSLKKLQDEAYN